MAWDNAQGPFGPEFGAPEGADPEVVFRALQKAMDFPDFQPPVQAAIGGNDGTLWMRREDMGGKSYRWLVLSPDGSPRGQLETPRHWTIAWVSTHEFMAVEPDDFDVPWLIKLRIGP
jgi:hypothetical protein